MTWLAVGRWFGVAALAAVGFLYAFAGLVAPAWGVGVLWIVYLAIVVIMVLTWKSRPLVAVVAGPVAWLAWAGIVLFGDLVLGWSA